MTVKIKGMNVPISCDTCPVLVRHYGYEMKYCPLLPEEICVDIYTPLPCRFGECPITESEE